MLAYPVTLTPDKSAGGFVVTCADIPEAMTEEEDVKEAMEMAQDALETALDFYFEDLRDIPAPSPSSATAMPSSCPPASPPKSSCSTR